MSEDSLSTLENDLQELSQSLESLPSVDEPPKTTLNILHQARLEDHWNSLLRYFLDPNEPHGLGPDLLEAVLNPSLSDDEMEFDKMSLEEARVKSEVQTSEGNRADIVVYLEKDWFVWFELKVGSGERKNQTTDYVNDKKVAGMPKKEFEEGFYVFISKEGGASSNADEFIDMSWEELAEVMKEVLVDSDGGYTARGKAQLEDFRDTIRSVTGMSDTESERIQEEKMKLYAEYHDEIAELENAFEKVKEREQDRWHNKFVEEFKPNGWSEEWNCVPNRHGRIYRDEWWLDEDGNYTDNLHFRIYFQHISVRRSSTFREGGFLFRTITPKQAPNEYRDEVKRLFNNEYQDEIKEAVEETGKDINYNISGRKNRTKYYYDFDPTQGVDEFYRTLREAFEDHYELADIISRVHKTAVEEVTDGELSP